MYFKQFFDEKLAQYAYLIGCQENGTAVIIDPMRDIDQYIDAAATENLEIIAAADTHIHADFVSGLREFAEKGVKVYASDEGGEDWKYEWLKGSSYHYELLKNGDEFKIGNITIRAWFTPGHTPEHLSYFVTDGAAASEPLGIATGDFVFVGDVGRPDLLESAAGMKSVMEPSARTLYKSVESFKDMPDYLQVWPGHGAGSACGKALGAVPSSTVGYELKYNNSVKSATSEDEFVSFILDGQPEPPLYFARMKKVNKEGPALLGKLPTPKRISVAEVKKRNGVIVDTRGKHDYMNGHIPGSMLATFDKNFNTIAGSYIEPENDIYLIIEESDVEQAVRDLIRVGLDNIRGYITPEDLKNQTGLESIEGIDFKETDRLKNREDTLVLDVRKATEYQEGHVPGSLNIAHTRLADQLDKIEKNQEILVHCASGQRASYASGFLSSKGYNVKWVDDLFKNRENPVAEKTGKQE